MSSPHPFFDRIVAATGLNELIAPFTVTRLLLRADVDTKHVTPDEFAKALPEFERGIGVYLSDEVAAAAMERLRALAAPA